MAYSADEVAARPTEFRTFGGSSEPEPEEDASLAQETPTKLSKKDNLLDATEKII